MKKKIRLSCLLLLLAFTSCTFARIVKYGPSGTDDYKIFPSRKLTASATPFMFQEAPNDSRMPRKINFGKKKDVDLEEFLKSSNTLAFLVIKDDIIIYERYYNGHNEKAVSMSFSMAKSFLSILIGCAIEDGYLKSVDQPITDFVPELAKNGFDKVSIKHLLQMTSGMNYMESDNPFGRHPRFYYTENLGEELLKLKMKEKPGTHFKYKSGDNQLLGLVLARALKPKTITQYMQEKIWEPLGMESEGLYSLDREGGLEKTFCCISAIARDFAKFGRLYLNKGNWNGKQIVPERWVDMSTEIDETQGSVWYYQYQWWIISKDKGDYMASGHLGQYLYVNPSQKLIALRLGINRGKTKPDQWKQLFAILADTIK